MKIVLCHFSATGNTARIADAISSGLTDLGAEVTRLDITSPEVRERVPDMSQYDAAVIGAPIHSMRTPRLVREWIETLDGQEKKCSLFLTYGGFQIHPAHFDAKKRLEARGFRLVGSADFPGAHTYNLGGWEAMAGRPDEDDCALARQYAEAVYKRFTGEDPSLAPDMDPGPYTEKQLDDFEQFRFKVVPQLPSRQGEECSLCLICQDICPSGAMNAEKGEADPERCIVCLGCLKNCPEGALKITDLTQAFQFKMSMDQETPESLTAKRGHLYL